MRPVVFVKYYEKGSTLMGADQISAALCARGADARSLPVRAIGSVRDSILVFIKTSKLPDLLAARRRGNILVLDLQDTLCFKRRIKNRWLFHGLLFKSARQLRDFGDARRRCAVIYHQWDPRYTPHRAGDAELKIAYLGLERSLRTLWGRLPDLPCIDHDYFARAVDFNCHLSIRDTRREFLYKPGTKVSTAAACGANLVTTRDEAALEMLGPDYPYYTEPDLASVRATIGLARRTIGGPLWRAGLATMSRLRERTAIAAIAEDYVRYCAGFA